MVSELRLNPESNHANGMILFYRAVSEISYGYAGVRGGVRRTLTTEYGDELRLNMVMCQSFAPKFSIDATILLERTVKQIIGQNALFIIEQIRETLDENDNLLIELEKKAHGFFDKVAYDNIKVMIQQELTIF